MRRLALPKQSAGSKMGFVCLFSFQCYFLFCRSIADTMLEFVWFNGEERKRDFSVWEAMRGEERGAEVRAVFVFDNNKKLAYSLLN
jgi:hypothetical protein